MFDMTSIGKKISVARKINNMTQMELADKMNVSFQAVSSWERGISMPDISKLPDIVSLLGLSIDELLGKNAYAVNAVISDNWDEYSKEQNITGVEVVDIISILKPRQTDDFFAQNEELLNIQEIEQTLPFLGDDMCSKLFLKYIGKNAFTQAEKIAPFVAVELTNQIVSQKLDEGCKVGNLIAFMDCDIRDSMILRVFQEKGVQAINDFLPFASKSAIEKIALIEYENNKLRYFECLAPFVDQKMLSDMAKNAIEKYGIVAISHLVQFIDKEVLKAFVNENYL
jgi:transcriptional regulator with XRE-family HTH domain